ncbi:MAG TPA: DnaJ C-terminal domain-containing protein [Mycobacteriales bacterium]|nr:DnaJ C-terminal domain-containing protein [Mycobacteriales bacterium]
MAGSPRDLYEVLGVARDADAKAIQRAYRKLARTYHPDLNKHPEAEERFKAIAEAYDVLSDPDTRRRYDAFGPDFRQAPDGVDPETWSRARRSGGRPGAGRGGAAPGFEEVRFGDFAGDIDIDEVLGGIFGSRGHRGWGTIRGADQETELEISVDEAYAGGRRALTVNGPGGPRTLQVAIPAGVTDGQRIRLAGQGGRGSGGGPSGDLYLVVRIAPHPTFRIEGRDVVVDAPLTPWEAALGTTVAVDTPGGEAKVKVPAGTSSGRRLRLRGRGLPNPRGKPGDLYAEAKVMVPKKPSDEERQLFEQLAAVSTFDPRRRR